MPIHFHNLDRGGPFTIALSSICGCLPSNLENRYEQSCQQEAFFTNPRARSRLDLTARFPRSEPFDGPRARECCRPHAYPGALRMGVKITADFVQWASRSASRARPSATTSPPKRSKMDETAGLYRTSSGINIPVLQRFTSESPRPADKSHPAGVSLLDRLVRRYGRKLRGLTRPNVSLRISKCTCVPLQLPVQPIPAITLP